MSKSVVKYVFAFCVTVFLAFAMLILVAFLPQERIEKNTKDSAYFLIVEGNYVAMSDRSDSTILDNFTDAAILMTSMVTSSDSLSSTLTNPIHGYGGDGYVDDLFSLFQDPEPIPDSYYTRYWMGFRIIVRPLLTIMNYSGIRQYMAYALLLLFSFLTASITRRIDVKTAMAFAVSFILVKPHVICNSLQFSCCFFIAFIAMLLVPWIHENQKYEKLFFMEIGMLTMYFDFYTTPVLTFGLPMVYLYLLHAKENVEISAKRIMANAVVWLTGYGLMWLAKLVLTTMLTSINALENGINSFLGWMGVNHKSGKSFFEALQMTWDRIKLPVITDSVAEVLAWIVIVVIAIGLICRLWKKTLSWKDFLDNKNLLLIGLFPVVWFIASARPIVNHYYFQYRSVSVIFWALGGYLCLLSKKSNSGHTDICWLNKKSKRT